MPRVAQENGTRFRNHADFPTQEKPRTILRNAHSAWLSSFIHSFKMLSLRTHKTSENYLKDAKGVDLKSSQHKKTIVIMYSDGC